MREIEKERDYIMEEKFSYLQRKCGAGEVWWVQRVNGTKV